MVYDTGWVLAGTGANYPIQGSIDWDDPDNITIDDGEGSNDTASASLISGFSSSELRATNFNFIIPPGMRIIGVDVDIIATAVTAGYITEHTINLFHDGVILGDNLADITETLTNEFVSYKKGFSEDEDWGYIPSLGQISDSNFGVVIRYMLDSEENKNIPVVVQNVYMKIYYEEAPTNQFFMFF